MARLKYLLMTPPIGEIRQKRDAFTDPMMSVGYLAAALREAGFDASVFDPKYEGLGFEKSIERIKEVKPDFVGISAMTHEITRAHRLASLLKEIDREVIIAVGGPHATSLPMETMEEFPDFDFAVKGEGEEAIVELASFLEGRGHDIAEIKGLLHRDGGAVRMNPEREWRRDLDRVPFPAWDLYPRTRRSAYPLLASRGCPFGCLFCMRVLGNRQRRRSPWNVADEMEWLVNNFNPTEIYFEDETFGLDKKWAYELCSELRKRGFHERVWWTVNLRANLVTSEFLAMLKESGCHSIGIGVESGSREILKTIKKGITLGQVEEAVRISKELKLEIRTYFILGHPGETLRSAMQTISFAARINSDYAVFGIMVPYPKTGIAEMIERNEGGYRPLSRNWEDFDKYMGNALELESLSRRQLELLQMFGYLFFYLRNLRLAELLKFVVSQKVAVKSSIKKIARQGSLFFKLRVLRRSSLFIGK